MCANIGRIAFRISNALIISPRPSLLPSTTLLADPRSVLVQVAVRNYAARKGTRARKEKQVKANKAAKKSKDSVMSPHLKKQMMSKMKNIQQNPLIPDEAEKEISTDNVFLTGHFQWPVYDVVTAVNNFKEVHHPTMYDNPKAIIKAYFELDLSTKKKTQFIENVSGVVELPHLFDSGKPIKTVCLFCKDKDLNSKALTAGADMAVGLEGLKMFQEGELDSEDYDVVLAHTDILPELAPIRGLISKKFPNIKKGTVAFDVVSMVKKFKNGVDYNMNQSVMDPKLGMLQVPIGTVDMDVNKLEANYRSVVQAVSAHKFPNMSTDFIAKGAITSENSNERFKVNPNLYMSQNAENEEETQESTKKKKAANA